MDYGESHVDLYRFLPAEQLHRERRQEYLSILIGHDHSLGFFQQFVDIFIGFDLSDLLTDVHFITLGHIDRDHFVFVCVHAHDSLDAGDYGYLVFYTLAAKQHCYSCLHLFSLLNFPTLCQLSGTSFTKLPLNLLIVIRQVIL